MLTMDKVEAPYLADLKLGDEPDILVVGAYKGDTVAFIREHHPKARIEVYEPQKWAAQECVVRFFNDNNIDVMPVGLGAGSRGDVLLYEHGTDAASILELPGYRTLDTIELIDAAELTHGPTFDLIFMNIEGYEYTLIPYMLGLDILPKYWMIQFHFQDRMNVEYLFCVAKLERAGYTECVIGKGWELWTKT